MSLLEKAWATKCNNSYERAEGGFSEQGIEALTGSSTTNYNPRRLSESKISHLVSEALASGRAVTTSPGRAAGVKTAPAWMWPSGGRATPEARTLCSSR